ncbi:integrase catalytic domain-containing protein [Trichonephila clavipes]|nr:integrase catalytic domain-containing protein [Trichonephila clavipes]
MTQIEGILNSRPLTPLSKDIDDLSVLTPAHFLIGRPITSIGEPNIIHIETNRLNIYQRLTKIVQSIWKRWSNNYLSNLQQRSKWKFEKDNARVSDLVLIKEDNLVVNKWLMGRLIETQARRRFVEWAQNEIVVVPDFHKRMLFSDEAHFWLNGYVNKQNCRIWSEANPQVFVETPLHPEKLTVWCALWAGGILLRKR